MIPLVQVIAVVLAGLAAFDRQCGLLRGQGDFLWREAGGWLS
jgi:hypothetical protein